MGSCQLDAEPHILCMWHCDLHLRFVRQPSWLPGVQEALCEAARIASQQSVLHQKTLSFRVFFDARLDKDNQPYGQGVIR